MRNAFARRVFRSTSCRVSVCGVGGAKKTLEIHYALVFFLFFESVCVCVSAMYVCECSGYNLNMRMCELFLFMSVNKRRQGFAYPPL